MGTMRKAAWLLAGALCALQAEAQEERALLFRVGGTMSWDSNVFRVPDSAPDPQLARGIEGKSDRYSSGYVGLLLDKTYANQRFVLDGTQRVVRYERFDTLDREELNYAAAWHWTLGERLAGSLTSSRSESLVPFEDRLTQGLNESVGTNNGATANARLFGGWYLLAGLSESKRRNDQTFLAQPDQVQRNHDLGARYTSDAGTSVSYVRRTSRGTNSGDVLNLSLSNDFNLHEDSLSLTWSTGGAQTVTGRLYWTEYRYPNTPGRDFSGDGGEVTHLWRLTDAFASSVTLARAVSPWTSGLDASYRVDETVSFAPTWRLSDRMNAYARLYRIATEYRGAIIPAFDQHRRDVDRGVSAGLSWRPFERVLFTVSGERRERSSTEPLNDYDATIVTIDASLSF